MNLDAIYELTPNAADRIAEQRLTLIKWTVLEFLTAHPGAIARTLATRMGMDGNAFGTILEEFIAAGVIHEPELSRSEYLERIKPTPIEPLALPSQEGIATPERKVSFTLRKRPSREEGPPLPTSEALPQAWLIKPLLDYVRERAGGGSLGQLAVYRMFLKVPQDLLKASKLEQLDLDSPDLQVSDAGLLGAIRQGACEVLGISAEALPASPAYLPTAG